TTEQMHKSPVQPSRTPPVAVSVTPMIDAPPHVRSVKQYCPHCDAELNSALRFCPVCYKPVQPMSHGHEAAASAPTGFAMSSGASVSLCPHCEAPLSAGSAYYCPVCHRKLK